MTTKAVPTAAQENDDDQWADIDGFVKFEYPGDSYVGTYLQFVPNDNYEVGSQQPGARIKGQFQFINDNGLASINWTAGLAQIQNVKPGTTLRVTFIEKQDTTAGFKTKAFRIQVPKSDIKQLQHDIIEAARSGSLVKVSSPQLEAADPLTQAGYRAPVDDSDPFEDTPHHRAPVAA